MPSIFENAIHIGTHVLNLQAVATISRVDHHAAGKVTRVELISGTQLEFFNAEGDKLWELATAEATKISDGVAQVVARPETPSK